MFHKTPHEKGNFLEQTKAARKERALEKQKETASIIIQSYTRGWITRIKVTRNILNDFDDAFQNISMDTTNPIHISLAPSFQMYRQITRLLFIWNKERDKDRFVKICRYLVRSLECESPKISYVGIALNKDHVMDWIEHMNNILWKCCMYLKDLKLELPVDNQEAVLFIHVLVSFTSTKTWRILYHKNMGMFLNGMNQLCSNLMGKLVQKGFFTIIRDVLISGLGEIKVTLRNVSFMAIITLTLRPLKAAEFSDNLMIMFLIHILSVPALISHLRELAPECISRLLTDAIFNKGIKLLSDETSMKSVLNSLEGNSALYLLANLLELAHIEKQIEISNFVNVVTGLLEGCQNHVFNNQSKASVTKWHPVLGWSSEPMDPSLYSSIPLVKSQLHILWGSEITQLIFGNYLTELVKDTEPPQPPSPAKSSHFSGSFLKKVFENKSTRTNVQRNYRQTWGPEVRRVELTCSMYHTALRTLTELHLDILTGLCYQNSLLHNLWLFLYSLGPNCGMKTFLNILAENTKYSDPEFQMLQLFCDCMTHYVTLLDDMEMYEQQHPFKLSDFIILSNVLNIFLYKIIVGNLIDIKTIQSNKLFQSLHILLMLLYRRDSRRSYTPPGHWLIKEIKVPSFLADLDKGRRVPQLLLQTMPHIIPHEDRVRLFRKYIANEKTVLGLTESACACPQPTIITVHRNRIVEDGHRQLAPLPPQSLKGVIRVRFINEQGLDEAGVDQDGVFKEFLEETIKKVIDPSLNLFKTTSEERLYPCPTSYLQDNHLGLFEFVGRMLGKAVYEGIVIDVPFASFFLSHVLGQTSQANYSYIDELPSLDEELYRSLSYIKHYEGDVSDLDLTFSLDEDNMGKIETHELIPGGKAISVTNENKITYIHLMAHFRMRVQIKHQTAAFIKGFKSIINPDWLTHFSTPELQRLISGDNVPLDLKDLRRHTQYYGGFHDSHRVVGWLWDILDKDFTEEEKAMFLKFVTSCSKPPLLGFAYLEPPFSIRCVEVGDDEDTGDTIGSVIRGFFTIRKKDPQNRLPTSSTCFNLLKLPNYQKKSTLREKLRYAVTCRTGFELS